MKVLEGGTSFYKSMHHRDFAEQERSELEQGKACEGKGSEGRNAGERNTDGRERRYTQPPRKSVKIVDCRGLQCPGPIMKVHEAIGEMEDGEILEVSATDMGFT